MAIQTPTAAEIAANIQAQLEAQLNQSLSLLPRAFNRVLAKALGGVFVILYKYLGFISLQQFIRYASDQPATFNGVTFVPLEVWGDQLGVSPRGQATRAELTIEFDVATQVGSVSAGQILYSGANGYTYELLDSLILNAATVSGTVRAVGDQTDTNGSGSAGNLSVGAQLQFAQPVANLADTGTVTAQTVTAADRETVEVYRQRVLDRSQKRPQGGAYADYELWAEEVDGIVNAYPYTGDPGEVVIYSEATVASSGSADGIPTAAQLTAVLNSVELDLEGRATRRPANALVQSLAISRQAFVVTVTGITGVDDLALVRSNIELALTQYFLGVEPFITGLSVPPRNDRVTRTRVSAVVEDIVSAAGGTFTSAGLARLSQTEDLPEWILEEGQKSGLDSVAYV